jgi:hypothetical protein
MILKIVLRFNIAWGVNNTRFEITLKQCNASVDETTRESFVVYQDNKAKNLMISNPLLTELAVCNLYDVAGKLIFSKKDLEPMPLTVFLLRLSMVFILLK